MKKKIAITLLAGIIVLLLAVAAGAATTTKNITATYRDIKMIVNGKSIVMQPDEQPFIYGGRTFVPIRFVSEALGLNVEWVDWISAVKINGSTAYDKETDALKAQLKEKDELINSLKWEIQDLKEKVDDSKTSSDDIDDLEDEISDDYDSIENVEIDDIALDGDEDDIDVDIEVDLDKYGEKWAALEDSAIKSWIKDLVSDLQDELSEDTAVSGNITDIDSGDVLVKFSKDGDGTLKVTYYDEDYRGANADEAVSYLESVSYYVGTIKFNMDVTYTERINGATVKMTAVNNDAGTKWEDLDTDFIEDKVEDTCKKVVSAFDSRGNIDLRDVVINYKDKEGTTLGSFEYDAERKSLN